MDYWKINSKNMKNLLLVLCLISVIGFINAQEKFVTKTGTINFEASVPSFEEVKATNNNVSAILTDNGTIVSLALVKGFRFKVALMEEHFNENYAESSEFPKTTLKGKITDFNLDDLSEDEKPYTISGVITLHGVEKQVAVPASIKIVDGEIYISSNFILKPEDFEIEIPSIVSSKIAEEITISVDFILKSKS